MKVERKILQNSNIYLAADKANSEKADAKTATFPKQLSFVDKDSYKILEFLLDVDASRSMSADIAEAIKQSLLNKLGKLPEGFMFKRGATDNRGGITKESFVCDLVIIGLPNANYRMNTCVTHNLQTILRNAILNVFGAGGSTTEGKNVSYKKNAMQLLNRAYNVFD